MSFRVLRGSGAPAVLPSGDFLFGDSRFPFFYQTGWPSVPPCRNVFWFGFNWLFHHGSYALFFKKVILSHITVWGIVFKTSCFLRKTGVIYVTSKVSAIIYYLLPSCTSGRRKQMKSKRCGDVWDFSPNLRMRQVRGESD